MIPKIVHYCWFGGTSIPAEYQKYIESWKRFLPEYEIREWNESNYDVHCIPFSEEAYKARKFAYVSDYARLKILYENGGIYFDTDVELINCIDDIIQKGPFLAFEKHTKGNEEDKLLVNIGLGFACEKGNTIIKEIMDYYEQNHYILADGTVNQIPIVYITTDVLRKHGLVASDKPIRIDGGITIYPWDYFCPMEYLSSKLELTDNTRTIHHYSATWMSWSDKLKMKKGYISNRIKSLFKKR